MSGRSLPDRADVGPPPAAPTHAEIETVERRARAALGEVRWRELRALADGLRAPGRMPARLLFTVTPGRSGTGALAHLLGGFRGVAATHEPRPSSADALRSAVLAPGVALEFWVRRKLPAIARVRGACYAETSHLTGLAFLDELALVGLPFELVLLTRPARAVARSLWRLDTIPGRTLRGHRYYLSPRDPVQLRLPPDALDGLHDYQLCYWYAREVEARQRLWAARAARGGPPVHHLATDELGGRDAPARLAATLGLGPRCPGADLFSTRRARRHRNHKDSKKLPRELPAAELQRLEEEVDWLTDAGPAGDPR